MIELATVDWEGKSQHLQNKATHEGTENTDIDYTHKRHDVKPNCCLCCGVQVLFLFEGGKPGPKINPDV